jgi:hypothetical protein
MMPTAQPIPHQSFPASLILLVIPSGATEPAVVLPPFSVLQLSGRQTMMPTAQPIPHQSFPASLILLVIPSEATEPAVVLPPFSVLQLNRRRTMKTVPATIFAAGEP